MYGCVCVCVCVGCKLNVPVSVVIKRCKNSLLFVHQTSHRPPTMTSNLTAPPPTRPRPHHTSSILFHLRTRTITCQHRSPLHCHLPALGELQVKHLTGIPSAAAITGAAPEVLVLVVAVPAIQSHPVIWLVRPTPL